MEAQKSINLQEAETEAADLCGKIFALGGELSTLKNDQKQNADTPDCLFDNIGGSSLDLKIMNDKDVFIDGIKPSFYSLELLQSLNGINYIRMFDFNTGYGYSITCDQESNEIHSIRTSKNAKKNKKDETVFDGLETIKNAEETINEKACISVYTTLLPKIQKLLETITTTLKDEINAKLHEQKEATANAINNHLNNFNV